MSSDDISQVESENETTPGEKCTKNPDQWKANKRKFARQHGESYMSTSGKVVEKKRTRPPCT